ncbi:MAG: ORF6N domain-containing protein [Candidatus Margulisiibacteriota bacterium]
MNDLLPIERIENRIYLIRGQKVMLDYDLAELYQVKTKRLNEQVRRNPKRFPVDFKFSLTKQEILRMSQIATSSSGEKLEKLKYHKNVNAFTEQGVAMLSSVLNSDRAIEINVLIMRAFVKLRQILSSHKELARKIEELEKKHTKHEIEITTIFKVLKKLMEPKADLPIRRIGFIT